MCTCARMCVHVHVPVSVCGHLNTVVHVWWSGTTCRNWFSLFIIWVLGIKLRSCVLATGPVSAETSCWPLNKFLHMCNVWLRVCFLLVEIQYCMTFSAVFHPLFFLRKRITAKASLKGYAKLPVVFGLVSLHCFLELHKRMPCGWTPSTSSVQPSDSTNELLFTYSLEI